MATRRGSKSWTPSRAGAAAAAVLVPVEPDSAVPDPEVPDPEAPDPEAPDAEAPPAEGLAREGLSVRAVTPEARAAST